MDGSGAAAAAAAAATTEARRNDDWAYGGDDSFACTNVQTLLS